MKDKRCPLCNDIGMARSPGDWRENGGWEECPHCQPQPKREPSRVLHKIVNAACFILFIPFWPLFWLTCRLEAKQCPKCASKWRTELVGEWDGEMWKCHACGHYWETPYGDK